MQELLHFDDLAQAKRMAKRLENELKRLRNMHAAGVMCDVDALGRELGAEFALAERTLTTSALKLVSVPRVGEVWRDELVVDALKRMNG